MINETTATNAKYMTENGFEKKYFDRKADAIKCAKAQSSWGTVVLCARNTDNDGFHMLSRYRFGRRA